MKAANASGRHYRSVPCERIRARPASIQFTSNFTNARSCRTTVGEYYKSYPNERRPLGCPVAQIRHAPLSNEFGRNVFKPYHHDRDVIIRISVCGLSNQCLRRFLGIRNGPYDLTGRLVIQNVPYLCFISRVDQKECLLMKKQQLTPSQANISSSSSSVNTVSVV